MKRYVGWIGASLLFCAVLAYPLAEAGAAPARIVGSGTPTCTTIIGKLTFNPPLKTGGIATSEGVSISGKVLACTGGTPTPTAGKISGKGLIRGPGANNCLAYFPTGTMTFTPPGFFVQVTWAGAITPTRVFFPTLVITNSGTTAPEVFNGTGPVTGSYLTTETLALATVKPAGVITGITRGNCGGRGGLRDATFGVPPTTGSF